MPTILYLATLTRVIHHYPVSLVSVLMSGRYSLLSWGHKHHYTEHEHYNQGLLCWCVEMKNIQFTLYLKLLVHFEFECISNSQFGDY